MPSASKFNSIQFNSYQQSSAASVVDDQHFDTDLYVTFHFNADSDPDPKSNSRIPNRYKTKIDKLFVTEKNH